MVSQVNSDYMLGVMNMLRRQLYVFLHVWGTLSFQVREYEKREEILVRRTRTERE